MKDYIKSLYYSYHKNDTPESSEVEIEDYSMPFREELSLEGNSLLEDTRMMLINKSKNADQYKSQEYGKNRWARMRLSKVANKVKMFNDLDMNAFVKQDRLKVNVPVQGETNEYSVTVQFDGVMSEIQKNVKANGNKFEHKVVVQSLTKLFNTAQVKVKCSCDDFKFRYAHAMIVSGNSADDSAHDPGPGKTGMANTSGQGCKHVLLVLNNMDWLMKLASTITNYIKYINQHSKDLFLKVIFPKLYGVTPDQAVDNGLVEDEKTLDSSKDLIDTINE